MSLHRPDPVSLSLYSRVIGAGSLSLSRSAALAQLAVGAASKGLSGLGAASVLTELA